MPAIDPIEEQALAALDLARERCRPLEPDQFEGASAWVSAAHQEEVIEPILAAVGIVIEFRGDTIVGGTVARTRWGWRAAKGGPLKLEQGWRSETDEVDVLLDAKEFGATGASQAALTTARKAYTRHLLGLRQKQDSETGLGKAMDSARAAAFAAAGEALRAYCKRFGVTTNRAIRAFTGIDPGPGTEATIGMLTAPAVALLWWKLECNLPHESAKFDPGESPKIEDDLPVAMGGQA